MPTNKKDAPPIKFFDTSISNNAIEEVSRVLTSGYVSEGNVVQKFEDELSKLLGAKQVVTVNSGTSALHLALLAIGVGPGDEVILPAQTFIATGLAILYCGATPIFADINYGTGNIDPESIRKKVTKKTKAIMVVHWGGNPAEMEAINKIALEHGIQTIEDAAHALGAKYKGKSIGTISKFSCFSFQAIKHITTGDGGCVALADSLEAAKIKKLRWFGIDRNDPIGELGERMYDLDEVGYKYHLNDYSAALGLTNLRDFEKRMERLKQIDSIYRQELQGISGLKMFIVEDYNESACWLFGMHVEDRGNFVKMMRSEEIPVSVVHQRIDRHQIFGGAGRDLCQQAKFDQTQIHIPIHPSLMDDQVYMIIEKIKHGW